MAKVKIQGHASGSGVLTVTAPNTSTDRTITLPDGDVTLGAATPSITDNGNANAMTIDSTGAVTMPAQPSFLVATSSSQSNIAANNSAVVVLFATERFDQNADFNVSDYTFTAPVTGKYMLSCDLFMTGVDTAATYYAAQIKTSNREFENIQAGSFFGASDPNYASMAWSVLADMDANDTAFVQIYQHSGTAQTDILTNSWFSGYLAC